MTLFLPKPTSRREMLRNSATLTGGAFLAQLFPTSLLDARNKLRPLTLWRRSAPS
jgi:hypothetical protein